MNDELDRSKPITDSAKETAERVAEEVRHETKVAAIDVKGMGRRAARKVRRAARAVKDALKP